MTSPVNVATPPRFDERVVHLALGVEPRDASSGARLDARVDVRVERFAEPVDRWRRWRPGETLTGALPRLPRHHSGRFALRYDERVDTTMRLRVVDDLLLGATRVAGLGRRVVPRRVQVSIASEAVVLAAEAANIRDPSSPPHPAWQRIVPLWCWPGAAADLPSRATVLRGRVVHTDPATGALVPRRWVRVRATDTAGDEVGWAHGDDRGEFVLVLERAAGDVVVPDDPLTVTLTVGVLPPAVPDSADPLRAQVDPLWDLPVEPVLPSPTPHTEPTLTGRRFLAEHDPRPPTDPAQPVEVRHGRETSIVVRVA